MSGELDAVFSAICYALSSIFLRKGQMRTNAPDNGLLPVLFIGSLCLVGTMFTRMPLTIDKLGTGNWLVPVAFCALAGVAGTLIGRLALYSTIARFGATRGVIINAIAPCVTLFIAVFVLDEHLDEFEVYGIACFALGLFLLAVEQVWLQNHRSSSLRIAVMIAICAPIFQGGGFVLRKMGIQNSIDPVFAAGIDICAALVLYIFLLAVTRRLGGLVQFYWSHRNFFFVFAGLASAFAIYLFFEASRKIPVSLVGMIIGIQPVIVALISALFLAKSERVSWMVGISSIIVTVGVLFMSHS